MNNRFGAPGREVDAVRAGLGLLQAEADRREKVVRWRRTAKRVAAVSSGTRIPLTTF